MSIRIIPQDELGSSEKRTADMIPPLLFPRLKNVYNRRAERLRELAENNPLGDYLRFAALIAHAQEVVLYDHPLEMDLTARIKEANDQGKPPLDIHVLPRDKHWQKLLHSLIAELKPEMNGPALAVIENLEKASEQELEQMASALFASDFASVSSDKAPFIWAALSLYWAQMASLIPGKARAEYGEARQYCPVCGSMPVSSMVQIDTTQGLRYLHCNLCETEWHVVRVKCSNCEQSRDLHYWSLENEQAAVKAESCGDCGTYLKILYQEKDPKVEAVADDLASLVLDARMEQEGFARSSINPFLFPGKGNKFFTQTGRSLPSGLQVIRRDHSRNIGKVFCIARHKLTTMDLCSGQNDRIREFHAILLPDNDASFRDFLCYANNIERT